MQARGRKMEAARNRAIEDADPVDRVDAELCAQRPVLNALMLLAAQIRESSEEVAQSVEGVVWEMDRERRGALCAPARQDGVELAHTIIDLLRGELLDDETRAEMVEDVRQALPPAPKRKASKARRARR